MPAKPLIDKVALIGVGFIGGSIGLALRKRQLAERVIGIDPNPHNLQIARKRKAIFSGTRDLQRGIQNVSLAVISAPVQEIPQLIAQVAEATGGDCLITDTGSVKEQIVAQVQRGTRYIGSHPMAGSEQQGPRAAHADLLEDRMVILTPSGKIASDDLKQLKQFWGGLGAHTVQMSPLKHDRIVASVSHMPHLAAAGLVAATPRQDIPHVASGWLDTTRIASSDADLWVDILCNNRDHVLKSAQRFGKVWALLCEALQQNDRKALKKILRDANAQRELAEKARK